MDSKSEANKIKLGISILSCVLYYGTTQIIERTQKKKRINQRPVIPSP